MKVTAKKLTDVSLMQAACAFTINAESSMSLAKIYECEHSPMRTQLFWIEMHDIPTFVSVHLVRHATVGQLHFVKSNRDDRGGDGTEDRLTPVNHAMLVNAKHLVDMSRKRLCHKSHAKTVEVMRAIKSAISLVDEDLSFVMVPECVYRNDCHELKTCGWFYTTYKGRI